MFHNILPCGKYVSKWDSNTSKICLFCHSLDGNDIAESLEHMLYSCPRVHNIWKYISAKFKLSITWKHVVIGYDENNTVTYVLNRIIKIVAYSFYKQWIISKQNVPSNYASANLWRSYLNELNFYKGTFEKKTEDGEIYHIYIVYI